MIAPAMRQLLLILCLSFACSRTPATFSARPPVVVLISIDTLRSDHLPAYGYRGVETPSIDAFRRDSVLFQHAYSHSPLTLPSHASVLTGLLPADHGVRDNAGFTLRPDVKTVAEVLKKKGYSTGAAVSAFVMGDAGGLSRGFDFYDAKLDDSDPTQAMSLVQRRGMETLAITQEWINQQSGPIFFLLHLYEPHSPYEPDEPYRSRYAASPYDGEIAIADSVVGKFLEFLKKRDLYNHALIILFSDHGEGLGEHREKEHGIFLYREAIQVPLIVKFPGGRFGGRRVRTPVGLTDVFPTIVQMTGSTAGGPLPGRSLLLSVDRPDEHRQIYSESYYARLHFGWSDLHSLIDGRSHFILAPQAELYDLTTDPRETVNVLEKNRRRAAVLRREIAPLIKPAGPAAAIDEESSRKLAALGYLTSTRQRGEVLGDPKLEFAKFSRVEHALGLLAAEQYEETVAACDALLRDQDIPDIWEARSRALAKLGRIEEAFASTREALQIPQNLHLAVVAAQLALELDRLGEAEQYAELAMETRPAAAREILARVWLARGDLKLAKHHALAALQADPTRVGTLLTLGRIEQARGDSDAALRRYDEAEAVISRNKKAPVPRLHLYRGDAWAMLGDVIRAEREWREEIRLFPGDPDAYKHLILLYLAQNRRASATELVYQLVDSAPGPASYLAVIDLMRMTRDDAGLQHWRREARERFPDREFR